MMNRTFWETCLHAWLWVTIGFAAMLAAAGVPALDGGAVLFYRLVSAGSVGDFAAPGLRLSVSLIGAVMLGWGVAMLGVWRAVGADPALWRGLSHGVLIWFVVDSAMSLATDFPINVVTNTLFALPFLVVAVKLGFIGRGVAQA
jgi:hypothetical protein